MREIICSVILSFFLILGKSEAKIVETQRFADILAEVDSNTIIFFDIDDTLINTSCMLGNTSWWRYFVLKTQEMKANPQIIDPIVRKIIQKVPVELIEEDSSHHIKNLQTQGILTFALTARSINEFDEDGFITYQQLKNVGIHFSNHELSPLLDDQNLIFFSRGIIFTNYQEKGPVLKKFLDQMDLHPIKIVFIDDNIKQIQSVESMAHKMNIPFIGFRYSKLDALHQNFDPLIVNIQLESLLNADQILSNEEASILAEKNPYFTPHYFLEELFKADHAPQKGF